MSEWRAIYFTMDPVIIKDFKEVFIGDENITTKIDKLQVAMLDNEYLVLAYKQDKLVEVIKEGMKVKSIMFCEGYIGFSEGKTYKIEIE